MVRLRRAEKRHRTTTLDRTLVGFRDQRGEREGAPILRHTVRIGIANNSGGASERQLLLFPADSLLSPLLSRSPRSGFLLSSVTRSRNTRGQWPYRPASTRAVRNMNMMLNDFNYISINVYTVSSGYMVFGYMVFSAIWSDFCWSHLLMVTK